MIDNLLLLFSSLSADSNPIIIFLQAQVHNLIICPSYNLNQQIFMQNVCEFSCIAAKQISTYVQNRYLHNLYFNCLFIDSFLFSCMIHMFPRLFPRCCIRSLLQYTIYLSSSINFHHGLKSFSIYFVAKSSQGIHSQHFDSSVQAL